MLRFDSRWWAVLLIVVAASRIASTYRVFSDTADEAVHVGAGLDLIEHHRYVVLPVNPPLPRIVIALAPRLSGMRFDPYVTPLTNVFFGQGKYLVNLQRARCGNLVFFVIAAIGVWLLARQTLDETTALLALLLFTTQPVVLGHSGLATHDAPGAAGVAVALLAFLRWLRAPRASNAALLGLAYGFGVLCKFSCLGFIPAACAAIFVVRLVQRRAELHALATLWIVPFAAALTLWAGYAFTVGSVGGFAHVPAPAFFKGLLDLRETERGFLSYALGRRSMSGWWWYFPLAFALKTTLATLIGAILGARSARAAEWYAASVVMMLPASPSVLDIGVRYVLPVYVPFSIAAAAGVMALWRAPSRAWPAVAAVLLIWHLGASALAHPDYFPYFNEIAARRPWDFLADSNLDWGQDALRLARFCRRHRVTALAYFISTPGIAERMGFPQQIEIDWWSGPPAVPAALGEAALIGARTHDPHALAWADQLPYVRVGKTIRVYDVDQ